MYIDSVISVHFIEENLEHVNIPLDRYILKSTKVIKILLLHKKK